jgi:hypothetical protein
MKKLLYLLISFNFSSVYSQSLVTDVNFQNWLSTNYPDAVLIDNDTFYIDGNHPSVQQADFVYLAHQNISNLSGIEAFSNLTELDCSYNQIATLENLPESLEKLICNNNQITSIAHIPSNIWLINCTDNLLQELPNLPEGLEMLNCRNNMLTSLPELPFMLVSLRCEMNNLSQLPTLPNGLLEIDCSSNQLTGLPQIPSSVGFMNCTYNEITELPSLSNFYGNFYCDFNQLTALPALSNNIFELGCSNNQLTELPNLPSNLQYLGCAWNQLTTLPQLPPGLLSLWATYNNITCFPPFPASLNEPNSVAIAANPFTCLPNYVPGMFSQDLNYPLCEDNDTENNPFGCLSTASSDELALNLVIYPNPFLNALKIEATSSIDYVNLWSVSGVQVYTRNNFNELNSELLLDYLEPGIYILDVCIDTTVLQYKVTKN